MLLVDIRELYHDKTTGELKPGAKGISLTVEQFAKLAAAVGDIRSALEGAGAKWPEPGGGGEAGAAASSSSSAAAAAAERPAKKQKKGGDEEEGDDDGSGGDGEDDE